MNWKLILSIKNTRFKIKKSDNRLARTCPKSISKTSEQSGKHCSYVFAVDLGKTLVY